MRELLCCQFTSVDMTVTIFNITTSGVVHGRQFSARNAATSLTTLAAADHSSYPDWSKCVSFIFYISRAPNMNHHRITRTFSCLFQIKDAQIMALMY